MRRCPGWVGLIAAVPACLPACQRSAAHRVEEAGGEVGPRGVLLQVYLGILKGGDVLAGGQSGQRSGAAGWGGWACWRGGTGGRRHVAQGSGCWLRLGLLRAAKPCFCLPTCIRDSSSLSFIAAAGFWVELQASRGASPCCYRSCTVDWEYFHARPAPEGALSAKQLRLPGWGHVNILHRRLLAAICPLSLAPRDSLTSCRPPVGTPTLPSVVAPLPRPVQAPTRAACRARALVSAAAPVSLALAYPNRLCGISAVATGPLPPPAPRHSLTQQTNTRLVA